MKEVTQLPSENYDFVGVGFGPANLSIAVANEELAENFNNQKLKMKFLEKKSNYGWHPGMLIDGTKMQISFLKDLSTLRAPTSKFTFLNYLHNKNRLDQFINLRDFYPTRLEYNDYLCWVAEHFEDQVSYNMKVESISPIVEDNGEVNKLSVEYKDDVTNSYHTIETKNLALGLGLNPWVPDFLDETNNENVFHSSEFLHSLKNFPDANAPYEFVVVGGAQSAVEICLHLLKVYPNCTVKSVIRGFGYKPAESSEFINELFFPSMVDFLFDCEESKREQILESTRNTNYSVVDTYDIRSLYELIYDQQVNNYKRFEIINLSELMDIEGGSKSAVVKSLTDNTVNTHSFDGLFLGTGYKDNSHMPLLENLSEYLLKGSNGRYLVERDYLMKSKDGFNASIYIQGANEMTHGYSDVLLSIMPIRSSDIIHSIQGLKSSASVNKLNSGATQKEVNNVSC